MISINASQKFGRLTPINANVITAWSWFGVNQLGVGLHSYGFTDGIWGALMSFWAVQAVVLGLGGVVWLKDRGVKAEPPKGKKAVAGA